MKYLVSALTGALAAASPAHAADEAFELWLNPSVSAALDDDTALELETAQRFRSSEDGRVDTYFFRLWLQQAISDEFTLAGAVEQRFNDGGRDETRTMQQLSGKHGFLRTRLRLEQRFVDGADRMGLRLRPRLGVAVPLDDEGRWSAGADAELFVTLRSTSAGGDDGLTGLRTQVGLGYDVSDRLGVSLTYLRQQDFEPGGPDEIGHAPLIGIEYAF
ncbi:DUF2490 domain-containing protein [Citromicrobium bathyomarinum]|uniref:DUF2490 domain-containing protein n=1 Tax=Citromicrobium bathyomarinum TaxID=72174 RepID=UPI00315AED5E